MADDDEKKRSERRIQRMIDRPELMWAVVRGYLPFLGVAVGSALGIVGFFVLLLPPDATMSEMLGAHLIVVILVNRVTAWAAGECIRHRNEVLGD